MGSIVTPKLPLTLLQSLSPKKSHQPHLSRSLILSKAHQQARQES